MMEHAKAKYIVPIFCPFVLSASQINRWGVYIKSQDTGQVTYRQNTK
jgi:hypothetical protein